MSGILLSLSGVQTHIERYHILQGVGFEVPRGGFTVLLGRNGAGKTTCLRTIMGLWRASAGTVMFDGADISRLATPDIARLGIGYVPEDMAVFGGLTVRENLVLATERGRMDEARLAFIFELFPALRTFWNGRAGNLSGGQKQMLAIARALIEPKKLLLVDEPTKGLAPGIISNMIAAFRELKGTDTTVLVVEQNFRFADSLGDTVAVMDSGRIVHTGRMQDLASDAALQTRLLGLSLEAYQ